ncbi:fimbria/pilus periplasmic chaperone [Enterobacteriaceae bacterium C34A]
MNKLTHHLSAVALYFCCTSMSYAGGIAMGATRVIYPQGEKQVSLPLLNTADTMSFLVQSWVSNADGSKADNFIITPPLFVMKPGKENKLRIIYNGPMLPQDRESVFYINSKAIPSVPKESLQGNTLQIATQSVIKLFMRPQGLPTRSVDAPKSLTCQLNSGKISITNPSPYYVTLVQFNVGGKKLPNNMVAPKSTLTVESGGTSHGGVHFATINDYGANTPVQECKR